MVQRIVLIAASVCVASHGQEFIIDQSRVVEAGVSEQALERARAHAREHRFVARANRVAALWTTFTKEYTEKRAFNIKLAREISKAFRDLEKDENWPKDRPK